MESLEPKGTQSLNNGVRGIYGDHLTEGEGSSGGDGGEECKSGFVDPFSEVKEQKSEEHGSSSDVDPLIESLSELELAKEALKKELQMFKEMEEDILTYDSVSDSGIEFIDTNQNMSSNSKHLLSECTHSFSRSIQSEVSQTTSRDVEEEVENLLKQKIEAEVEYIAISKTVQTLRVAAGNQAISLEEQKALVSEHTHILNKLGAAENKAALHEKETKRLEESISHDIACADEVKKLQKGFYKYGSYFLMQIVMLLVVLRAFRYLLPRSYVEVVPT